MFASATTVMPLPSSWSAEGHVTAGQHLFPRRGDRASAGGEGGQRATALNMHRAIDATSDLQGRGHETVLGTYPSRPRLAWSQVAGYVWSGCEACPPRRARQ